ncbi:MAG TPA: pyridoxine 5'-phosphate synthase [Acidobacteriota bacterium]|nr:pyridoxine 5'-phosphate synthase [Acidobacteriota bacterium]
MTKLGVNIDHVATVREARRAPEPDPVAAAILAELAGAHGITVHLRGDRRHIKDRDVRLLRQVITTRLNIEMAATEEMVNIALDIRPDQVTLVPESPNEITTQGGLDVPGNLPALKQTIRRLAEAHIAVSLFVDPLREVVERSAESGAGMVELNTAAYSEAVPKGLNEALPAFRRELERIQSCAELAESLGLQVLAGHGLTYRNVRPISDIPQIIELNIGHNIVCRAVLVGFKQAVSEMLEAMNG